MTNGSSDVMGQSSFDAASAPNGWRALQAGSQLHGPYRWLRRALILLPVAATLIFGALDWRALEARTQREAIANVALIRDYTLRLVESQELLLRSAQTAVSELRNGPERDLRAHRFLASLNGSLQDLERLALVAQNGDVLLSSTQFPARGNVVHREYVTMPLAGVEPFIDRLTILPENRDVFIISRASSDPSLPGVWTSAVNIEVVTAFLSRISPDHRNAASLLREDGKVLARHVPSSDVVVLNADQPAMQAISQSDSGTYIATAVSDGIRRSYAYTRIGDLPVFAIAGVSRTGTLRTWLQETLLFGAMLGVVSFAVFQLVRVAELRRIAELDRLRRDFDRERREAAEKTAAFRDTMLKELNHRVKNSLAMISGLIKMEHRRSGGPDLHAVNARVVALGHIHDLLHRSSLEQQIDIWALIRDICTSEAIIPPERGIGIECSGSSTLVDDRFASPITLSLIELVTNAQKHAFVGRGGTISVSLEAGEEMAFLRVRDDGTGMAEDRTRNSGLRIVEALVQQIDGRLEIKTDAGGTDITIAFPLLADPPEPK